MSERDPKIYLLPNLMTAGNLFCGFSAILRIFEGMMDATGTVSHYYEAIWFILGACFFDLLDGRVARLVGADSEFGREFDSLADIVSFGIAPALLVFDIVLAGIPEGYGYIIAFVYLLCGAMRLARFNCVTHESGVKPDPDFRGFPIPAAAGLIASLTFFLLYNFGGGEGLGAWRHLLWVLMLLLSYMMFSDIRYPSFKGLNWKTKRSLPWVFVATILVIFTVKNYHFMPAVVFLSYFSYGLVRPSISRRMRRKIEIESTDGELSDIDEDELEEVDGTTPAGKKASPTF